MPAGRYESTKISPSVTLTIPSVRDRNAWYTYEDLPKSVDVGLRGTSRPRRGDFDISIHVLDRVLDLRTAGFVPAPDDPVAWLGRLPSVTVGRTGVASVAGLPGRFAEVAVGRFDRGCCLTISRSGFFLVEDSRARFQFLEAGTRLIAVIVRAPAEDFDWFLEHAEPVVRSIRFG